jgi:hypothetical protein
VTKHQNSSKWISNSLSRRDVLRAGGLLLPATLIAPTLFTRVSHAAGGGTFNYYISTNGNDSNPGTLALPWAITGINTHQAAYAGKRVGILPGVYDVSRLMANANYQGAVLQINGGPNSSTPTYIGTCDASGAYEPGTATLDSYGSVGQYGGGSSSAPYVIGVTSHGGNCGPQPPNLGNWTLDGLIISGFSNWAITLCDDGGEPAQIPNVVIQNCTLTNSVCGLTTTHPGPIMLYRCKNVLVSNCWLYNNKNTAADGTHYAGILIFGISGPTTGVVIEKCSLINSSCIYVAEDNFAVDNITVRQCYFDMTAAGQNFHQSNAMMGFSKTGGGLIANSIHHNIVKGGYLYDCYPTNQTSNGMSCYNNTLDLAGGSPGVGMRFEEASGSTGIFSCYNNLFYDNGATGVGYGYNVCNVDGFSVCDYNIYGMLNKFGAYGANGSASGPNPQTFVSWKSATGRDAHSSTNSANPFTKNGVDALQYQVQSGSPAYKTGRIGGLSSGAVCNVGAWDGTVTQIGYAAGAVSSGSVAEPNPPVLTVVS